MARLHRRFTGIHKTAVAKTQRFFESKPWSGSEDDQQTKFETWLRDVSAVYGVPQPTLTVTTESDRFGLVAPNTVYLNKFSVTSLFHAFRAHLQYVGTVDVAFYNDDDAQAWACSLFYTCRPILFRKAVRDRRIAGVFPDDLLTSATLASRQDEVDEAFAGLMAASLTDEEIEDDDATGEDDDVPTVATMAAESEQRRVSVAEAATILECSQSTVRNRIRSGEVQSVTEGRRVFVLLPE
jgi:hypothetical protein